MVKWGGSRHGLIQDTVLVFAQRIEKNHRKPLSEKPVPQLFKENTF
jgi:hypothetical protein